LFARLGRSALSQDGINLKGTGWRREQPVPGKPEEPGYAVCALLVGMIVHPVEMNYIKNQYSKLSWGSICFSPQILIDRES
jgi:hypothetical protein